MRVHDLRRPYVPLRGFTALATAMPLYAMLGVAGCNRPGEEDEASGSGFTDSAGNGGPGQYLTSGGDEGAPAGPGDDVELCDAGNEAWAKRVIPLIHGRRPESIREVRVIAQMVEQLDALGENGRYVVAMGLGRGDHYLARWKQWIYDQLAININSDRRNEECYDVFGAQSDSTALAEHIRDNPATVPFAQGFHLGDVVYSALRLDDLSPAYRADMFARQSAPVVAGNVTHAELEALNVATYGKIFESAYLGRFTECMDCHRYEFSVTDSADPYDDRHWPLPGNTELAVYGPDLDAPNSARAHAIFRRFGFSGLPWLDPADPIRASGSDIIVDDPPPAPTDLAWGMDSTCGLFRFDANEEYLLFPEPAYMVGSYDMGSTVFDLDNRMREGFTMLYEDGLITSADGTIQGQTPGVAWLFSANIANRVWREAMGYPLTVANNFPRNAAQHDTLLTLAQAFADNRYSLRNLLATVATIPYFNQLPPDSCGASTAYHMPAIFDPFTKGSSDPTARGNGVGDTLHRYSARVLLNSLSQAMWWDRAQGFGDYPGDNQRPGVNCGTGAYPACSEEPALIPFLRDMGVFLNDSEAGFNGVDFGGLLRWEQETGQGLRIEFEGDCTGPLGGPCSGSDWITELLDVAYARAGTTLEDVVVALKDRLITEDQVDNSGEASLIERILGAPLDTDLSTAAREMVDAAIRRYAGVLVNTPQFLIAGLPSTDQEGDPVLVVPGTSTSDLCSYLGDLVLANDYDWSCGAEGITISG